MHTKLDFILAIAGAITLVFGLWIETPFIATGGLLLIFLAAEPKERRPDGPGEI